ncbi:LysR family transcriptional regulator [Pseudomonas nitroreducens]|uniref:LysR family transcriptional regulator n=1 Tax=Pseudomonas nitroreducens TaxID=46680 RepID=UPI002659563E|nr:LysR family transcriptional regulator [Pseudomonas nitroreducens]MCP1651469.1 DNA-binding transcriptional LysR family regulator [Pseudomonas nitroreducens]MCP1689305.1 DNA-binding transcriptional LysR family regulator [Pseudomonas nitroreducens]
MDRLTSMEVFVRAVDLGSFAAAADALEMSAPMVGKHVRFLEERLGAQLLLRSTRRQSLTEAGRIYYERCRALLADAEAADILAAGEVAEPRGRLRVALPVHFGRRCVAPVLLELAQRYPLLELDLRFSDRLTDLADEQIDLAIRTGEPEPRAGIIARRIGRQRMVVCAAPAYLAAHGRPDSIQALALHQVLVYHRSGRINPWLFPAEGAAPVEFLPSSRLRFDDLAAIADAAVRGMGLAWLPFWLVRDVIEAGALEELLPQQPGFLYDVHATWLQSAQLPRKVRLAIDALIAAIPGLVMPAAE